MADPEDYLSLPFQAKKKHTHKFLISDISSNPAEKDKVAYLNNM